MTEGRPLSSVFLGETNEQYAARMREKRQADELENIQPEQRINDMLVWFLAKNMPLPTAVVLPSNFYDALMRELADRRVVRNLQKSDGVTWLHWQGGRVALVMSPAITDVAFRFEAVSIWVSNADPG